MITRPITMTPGLHQTMDMSATSRHVTRKNTLNAGGSSITSTRCPACLNLKNSLIHAHNCFVRAWRILRRKKRLSTWAYGLICKHYFTTHFTQPEGVNGHHLTPVYRYTFDVLGELFYGKMFGFMHSHTDIGGYMKAIDSLLPAFTVGGTLPSYLTKLYFLSTVIISPSVRGALGAVANIESASKAAVERRRQELAAAEEKDNKHDILRKMLEIHADRGEKINFTFQDIVVESHSSM